MTDVLTKKPMALCGGEETGFYVVVPVPQLDQVRTLLDDHRVRYRVDRGLTKSLAVVHFGNNVPPFLVQSLLDSLP